MPEGQKRLPQASWQGPEGAGPGTFLYCFNTERPVRLISILIGCVIGFVTVLSAQKLPPVAGIVVPAGWILLVEYALRILEWLVKKGIPLF